MPVSLMPEGMLILLYLNGDQQAGDALARRGGRQIQQMRQTGIFRCRKGVALTVEIGVPGDDLRHQQSVGAAMGHAEDAAEGVGQAGLSQARRW